MVVPDFLRIASRKSETELLNQIGGLKNQITTALKQVASVSSQLEASNRELLATRQALENEQSKNGVKASLPQSFAPPSSEEIEAKINAWKGVDGQLNDFNRILSEGDVIVPGGRSDQSGLTQKTFDFRQRLGVARNRLNIFRGT